MDNETVDTNLGMSRRTLLRRGAVVGGALVWAAPAVQTIARSAHAAEGSPECDCVLVIYREHPDGTRTPLFSCTLTRVSCECLCSGQTDCSIECQ